MCVQSFLSITGKKPQILKQDHSVTTSVLAHEYDKHGTLNISCEITHTDKTTDDMAINRAKVDVKTGECIFQCVIIIICAIKKFIYLLLLKKLDFLTKMIKLLTQK